MKNILTISGSSRVDSSNMKLLQALEAMNSLNNYIHFKDFNFIPLFAANDDQYPWPNAVVKWRQAVKKCDVLIICTPEYIHNIPAQIKSALEWLTSGGELAGKRTLAITYTPSKPRGQKAMQSLLWSLEALDANVIAQVDIYQDQIRVVDNILDGDKEIIEMLQEVLIML